MSEALAEYTLSRDEARTLTDEVRGDAERLWRKLVELYEGGAHIALGYSSWGSYFKAEFGGSSSRGYQLLDAGRVVKALESFQTSGMAPPTSNHAVALRPLKDDPVALKETWDEVIETHEKPTGADVREAVERRIGMSRKTELNAKKAKERIERAVGNCNGLARGLKELNLELARNVATEQEIKGWIAAFEDARRQIVWFRDLLKEDGT